MWHRKRKPKAVTESPEKLHEKSVILRLGHAAETIVSKFSCGGKLPPDRTVSLAYKTALCRAPCDKENIRSPTFGTAFAKGTNVKWCSIEFPSANRSAVSNLLDAGSVDSYAYKGEFKCMNSDDFMTSFQLCDTPILGEIGLIIPNRAGLQASLYKMNICATGGYFKARTTYSSREMFGTLVVCLPTQFSGGELVLRHLGKEVKYDWSSSASDPLRCICWAAFFSNIEHEVVPVTEGFQVTLTYILYYDTERNKSTIDTKSDPFYNKLLAALSNPMFMSEGGILGFKTQYSYTFDMQWTDLLSSTKFSIDTSEIISKLQKCPFRKLKYKETDKQRLDLYNAGIIKDTDVEKIIGIVSETSYRPRLKGADYIIYNSASSLGLRVQVKPILKHLVYKNVQGYALRSFDEFQYTLDTGTYECGYEGNLLRLFGGNACQYTDSDITWCQEPQYNQPAGVVGCYGNDPSVDIDLWYKAGVILIAIPRWKYDRQRLVSGSYVTFYDNIEFYFKDIKYDPWGL